MDHSSFIIPQGRNLLHNIRKSKDMDLYKFRPITIPLYSKKYLKSLSCLMKKSRDGISFNKILERIPTKLYISYSCPVGMRVVSIHGIS